VTEYRLFCHGLHVVSANETDSGGWRARSRHNRIVRTHVAIAVIQGGTMIRFDGPVEIWYRRVYGSRGKPMDGENLARSTKPVTDAIRRCGIIHDDSPDIIPLDGLHHAQERGEPAGLHITIKGEHVHHRNTDGAWDDGWIPGGPTERDDTPDSADAAGPVEAAEESAGHEEPRITGDPEAVDDRVGRGGRPGNGTGISGFLGNEVIDAEEFQRRLESGVFRRPPRR
jgi:hypothetical protein